MKCKQVRVWLSAYDSDELSTTERQMIDRHLAGCVDCSAALAAHRAVREQFALLEHLSVNTEIADETIARIRAEGVRLERPAPSGPFWLRWIGSILAAFKKLAGRRGRTH